MTVGKPPGLLGTREFATGVIANKALPLLALSANHHVLALTTSTTAQGAMWSRYLAVVEMS